MTIQVLQYHETEQIIEKKKKIPEIVSLFRTSETSEKVKERLLEEESDGDGILATHKIYMQLANSTNNLNLDIDLRKIIREQLCPIIKEEILREIREKIREEVMLEVQGKKSIEGKEDEFIVIDYNTKEKIKKTLNEPKCKYIRRSFARKENDQLLRLMAEHYPLIGSLANTIKDEGKLRQILKEEFNFSHPVTRKQVLNLWDRLNRDILNPLLATLIAEKKLKRARSILRKYPFKGEHKIVLLEKLSALVKMKITEEHVRWGYVYLHN